MLRFNVLLKQKAIQLFFLILAHNTLLDLCVFTSTGVHFFTAEALTITTIGTHFWIASVVSLLYILIEKMSARITVKSIHFPITSLVVLLGFGWFKFS